MSTSAPKSAHAPFVAAHSSEDASVNWVRPADVGHIEARYVRRSNDYVVVYLSSQTGCRQACRMCHLTATGQTHLRQVTHDEMLAQADLVLEHYRDCVAKTPATRARSVHFNFMARGEPLANPLLVSGADALLGALGQRAMEQQLLPRYLVSTILPRAFGDQALEEVFVHHHPEIYYSIYSVRDAFRKRWLPNAMPVAHALDRLASWQRHTYKIFKIHYAFIEGENDSEAEVHAICDALLERRLSVHVNLVRYNPPNALCGVEPPEDVLARNAQIFASRLPNARVRVIPRVGFDVQASCGMFIAPHES